MNQSKKKKNSFNMRVQSKDTFILPESENTIHLQTFDSTFAEIKIRFINLVDSNRYIFQAFKCFFQILIG